LAVSDGHSLGQLKPPSNGGRHHRIRYSLPNLNGIAAARKIRESLPRIKFIFITMHSDRSYRAEAIRVGAEELNQAIHGVIESSA
jgi:DNA-binding NarL/FixJ family response regulator